MSDKTIVALYDNAAPVERVLAELDDAGIPRSSFQVVGGSSLDSSSTSSAAERAFGSDFGVAGSRVSSLTNLGVPESDAQIYAEGVRRGGVLLVGRVDESKCGRALDIIERYDPVDPELHGQRLRESGWTGYDETAADYDETQATEERSRYATGLSAAATGMRDVNAGRTGDDTRIGDDTTLTGGTTRMDEDAARIGDENARVGAVGREEHIPIAEERIEVGKRAVEHGGVRVRARVVEMPVEEIVRLRQEHVTVERREVSPDRAATEADFQDRTIEVTETDEVPVVSKSARVTGEVVVRKDVEERSETVSDTVRRTEVDVDDRTNRPEGSDLGVDRRDEP
jgi:uncharacterized protein (TIGR02271 family)